MKIGGEKQATHRIRLLTREEAALWRQVTADVRPRVKNVVVELAEAPPAMTARKPAHVHVKKEQTAKTSLPAAQPQKNRATAPGQAPISPLDRRLKRKLASGRAEVDDAIDLHGMTQAQAHRSLSEFLWRAAGSGAKLVLVITGKGDPARSGDVQDRERGVLRRCAPLWLRSAELRSIVLSVDEAARPHGGSGALYVRLRNRFSGRRNA
jgi:DNA-nicking Smr family endonuclease